MADKSFVAGSKLRRALRWTTGILATLVLLFALAWGLLQTNAVQNRLAAALGAALSGPGLTVTIDGLDGPLPQSPVLTGITVADDTGPWLTVDSLRLDWRPLELLRGHLHVTEITAPAIDIARPPEPAAAPTEPDGDSAGGIPPLPVTVQLDRLTVGALRLGEPLLGNEAILTVEGSAASRSATTARTDLTVRRIDGTAGQIVLRAAIDLASEAADLSLVVDEPPGGLIARAADIPDLPALRLTVTGKGAIGDWRGRLDGAVDGVATLGADLALDLRGPYRLRANGRATVEAIGGDLRPLINDGIDIDIDMAFDTDAWRLDVAKARLSTATAELGLTGGLDLDSLALTGEASARLVDPGPVNALIAPVVLSDATVDIGLGGTATQPNLTVNAGLGVWTAPGIVGRSLHVDATVDVGAAPDMPIDLQGTVTADGLAVDDPAVAGLVRPRLDATFDATLEPAAEAVTFRVIEIANGDLRATVAGSLLLDGPTADLSVDASLADLARLADTAGLPLTGEADLTTLLRLDRDGTLTAQTTAATRNLSTGIGEVDTLLGPTVSLAVSLRRDTEGALAFSDLAAESRHAKLTGDGTLPADLSRLDAAYSLTVRDLAPLGGVIGQPLAGRLEVEGKATGDPADPDLSGTATLRRLAVADTTWETVLMRYDGREVVSAPRVGLGLRAVGPLGDLEAAVGLALRDDRLAVDPLTVNGLGTTASGRLDVPLDGGPVTGDLRAEAASVADLASLLDLDAGGAVDLRLTLRDDGGRQAVEASFAADRLSLGTDGRAVSRLTATVSATDLLGTPRFTAEATAGGVAADPVKLDHVTATAEGGLDDLAFRLAAGGDVYGTTELAANGRFVRAGEILKVTLAALDGKLSGQHLRLRQPATLTLDDGFTAVDGLAVTLAGGEIDGTLRLAPDDMAAKVDVRRLPLRLANLVAPDLGLGGTIDASAELSGPPTSAAGRFHLQAEKMILAAAGPDQPPITVTVDGDLNGGRLRAEATAAGLEGLSARVTGDLPVTLSAAPFTVELPEDQPTSASLSIAGEIAPLWAYVPIDGHRLSGRLDADLTLSGSLAAPRIKGRTTLAGGHYENMELGTELVDLTLSVEGDESGLRSIDLAATDGVKGRLQASGRILFDNGMRFELNQRFSQMRLVRRDDLLVVAGGDLSIAGTPEKMAVDGKVTTDTVEAWLVDNLPPGVTELKVDEEKGGSTPVEKPAEQPPTDISLNLEVDAPRQVFVRGRGLDSEWGGSFRITGTAAEPRIAGGLKIVRGVFNFSGKRFDLTRGAITIPEGSEINPTLDILAAYSRSDFTANIAVTGPATQPTFTLSSTPTLPRDEILSRILFGQGTAKLSALQALQLAEAAATLSGKFGTTGGVIDKVRRAVGVDVLRVESDEEGGPTVRAGKYVTDQIYVGTKQGSTAGSTAANVEVELTPNISVESEIGQDANSQVGVKWKYDY